KIAARSRPVPAGPALPAYALAALVAAAFLALHLPYLPASLEDLDSINFALGLRHFDVAAHQPHPPGYPLYIAAGKAVHRFIPSEAKALALAGIAAGALGAMVLVALFTAIDGRGPRGWSRARGAPLLR